MQNHFVRDKTEYRRNLDIVSAYYKDSATYLSKMSGKPYQQCLDYVKRVTDVKGKFPLIDPDLLCLSKEKEGEREKVVMKFSEYINDIVSRKDIMAPTFTTYLHPKRNKSLLAIYIDNNLKKRSKLKKESIAAEMAGDMPLHHLRENQQNSTKIKNNAMSGAHASSGTPLFNKSSHSTLTSICRSATAYGNANNEKFISGNRHYWCPDVAKASIVSIVNNVDLNYLESIIIKFGIHYPTVEETIRCVSYSTDLYWRNTPETTKINQLITSLSPVERAAFVYVGDLYHLAKYNDTLIRTFIDKITNDQLQPLTLEESESLLGSADADLVAYVSLLSKESIKGKTLKVVKSEAPEIYGKVGAIAKNVLGILDEYQELIKAFFVTNVMPSSIANLPNSIRRSALASDTDSTIFTVQEWGKWYTGKYDFSKESCAVTVTITYLTSQAIIHILAMMCANMGVDRDDIHRLQMKNEFAFPVFVLTPKAKHYYASMSAREGNVFEKLKKEIKGVGLRSSNCPPEVMADAHAMIDYIMDTTYKGELISIEYCFDIIAGYENKIRKSVESGRYEYLTKGRINSFNAYKNPHSSAYVYYELWKEVFADKYGHCDEPPYTAIKASIGADSKTELEAWLNRIDDIAVRERFRSFLASRNKTSVSNILLPESIVAVSGIPIEIIRGIDIRKLIYETVKVFYSILESLGIFMIDDNNSRLVSDFHIPKE